MLVLLAMLSGVNAGRPSNIRAVSLASSPISRSGPRMARSAIRRGFGYHNRLRRRRERAARAWNPVVRAIKATLNRPAAVGGGAADAGIAVANVILGDVTQPRSDRLHAPAPALATRRRPHGVYTKRDRSEECRGRGREGVKDVEREREKKGKIEKQREGAKERWRSREGGGQKKRRRTRKLE